MIYNDLISLKLIYKMDTRHLHTLITLVNNDFNVSRSAEKLYLVQSAVSQQLKRMEEELEGSLFIRKGKRLTGLTELGEQVIHQARHALNAVDNIYQLSQDYKKIAQSTIRIGCTHTQARYILPPIIKQFNKSLPNVELQINQGTPVQLVEWILNNDVDFSICTEELAESKELESTPCYRWNRSLITEANHPLQKIQKLTLKDLVQYPIITYVLGFTGRRHFNESFTKANLNPNVILSAADTDIIKAYVHEGLGVGIIASVAINEKSEHRLRHKDLSHLFPWETTRIAYLKNKYITRHQQTFLDLFLKIIRSDRSGRIKMIEH